MMIKLFCLVLFIIITVECNSNSFAKIKTKASEITGFVSESRNGNKYSGFRGIQYANVKTRFQAAVPIANSINGNKTFLEYGNDCPQISIRTGTIATEEQCLFLNVYVPHGGDEKKPVIFYIHGGAWVHGSARDAEEKYFMDEDVILVTLNYRLGAFGFLAVQNNLRATGNYALTDQILGLKWVQENIGYFNGDKDSVTIMGESAGAASVSHLVCSPAAAGLFHKAIGHSGAIFNPWAWREMQHSEPVAFELGRKLGCFGESSDSLLDCLLQKDVLDILKAQKNLPKFFLDPMVPFTPVVDSTNPNAFMKQSPLISMADGNFNKVPMILTLCKDEGLLIHSAAMVKNEELLEELDKNWIKNGAIQAILEQDSRLPRLSEKETENLMLEIRKFYFGDKNLQPHDDWTLEKLTDFYSDRYFIHGVRDMALKMAKHMPVYTGIFTRNGEKSIIQLFGYEEPIGVSHADDLQFFFNSVFQNQDQFPLQFHKYSSMLIKLWTNFAKTGIPSVQVNHKNIIWEQVSEEEISSNKLKWMDLGNMLNTIFNPFKERLNFWDEIYKIYSDINARDEL